MYFSYRTRTCLCANVQKFPSAVMAVLSCSVVGDGNGAVNSICQISLLYGTLSVGALSTFLYDRVHYVH